MRCLLLIWTLTLSIYLSGQDEGEYTEFSYPDGTISSAGILRDGQPDGYWKTYFPSGQLKSEGNRENFKLDSTWVFYNEEGELIQKIDYKEGKRDGWQETYFASSLIERCQYVAGILNGICLNYENGYLESEIPYVDDKKEGKGYEFNTLGEIEALLFYKSDFLRRKETLNRRDDIGRRQGIWKSFYEDRQLQSEGTYVDDLKHGLFKTYDPKGELISMEKYVDGKLDEEASETSVVDIRNEYDTEGRITASGAYKEGEKHGVHRSYDTEGNIIASATYSYGVLVSEGIVGRSGKIEGPFQELYESGEVRVAGDYKDGMRSGEWIYYNEQGRVSQKGRYRKGKAHGDWVWYYGDGTVRRREVYRNGREDGQSEEYNRSGQLMSKGQFIDGLKEGQWYYHIGDHIIEGAYKAGEKDGQWMGTYENGKTQFKGKFANGYPKGKHRFYYANGALKQDGKYSSGRKKGDWRLWDEDGEVIMTTFFDSGVERRIEGVKVRPTYEELQID